MIITPPWRQIFRRLEWRVSKLAQRQKAALGTEVHSSPCPQSCTWGRAQDRTRPETSLLSHTGLGVWAVVSPLCSNSHCRLEKIGCDRLHRNKSYGVFLLTRQHGENVELAGWGSRAAKSTWINGGLSQWVYLMWVYLNSKLSSDISWKDICHSWKKNQVFNSVINLWSWETACSCIWWLLYQNGFSAELTRT